jgi:hypothetical protein
MCGRGTLPYNVGGFPLLFHVKPAEPDMTPQLEEVNKKIAALTDLITAHLVPRVTALQAENAALKAAQVTTAGDTDTDIVATGAALENGVQVPLANLVSTL